MDYFKNESRRNIEHQLAGKIKELMSGVQNGSVSIIIQDNLVIQINTSQKILIRPNDIKAVK